MTKNEVLRGRIGNGIVAHILVSQDEDGTVRTLCGKTGKLQGHTEHVGCLPCKKEFPRYGRGR
jgi:hypothetical protein